MKPLRIAVCDDEQAECELMEKYIREWAACRAYQALVLSFSGGEALLQAFFQKGFDLVLLDIQMQGTDGMSAARRIRAADPDAGIFFVTGYEDYLAEGYEVEAFRYLKAPAAGKAVGGAGSFSDPEDERSAILDSGDAGRPKEGGAHRDPVSGILRTYLSDAYAGRALSGKERHIGD